MLVKLHCDLGYIRLDDGKCELKLGLGYSYRDEVINGRLIRTISYDLPFCPSKDTVFLLPFDDFRREACVDRIVFDLEAGECNVFLKDPFRMEVATFK